MKKHLTLKNLGWVITALVSIVLFMSGVSKIVGTEEMVKNFEFMHLTPYMRLIGVAEVLGVGMLVYPKTSKYGAYLLSTIMFAAVALHLAMMGGANVNVPLFLGLGAWTAHCLRDYTRV